MTADTTLAPCPTEHAALLHDLDVIACTTLHATIEGSRKSYERDVVRKAIEVIRAQASAPKGIEVVAYGLGDIKIEKVLQMAGPAKWAVRRMGDVLNRTGGWEWEPSPSGRDDAFLDRCRFESAECAILAAHGITGAPNGKPT